MKRLQLVGLALLFFISAACYVYLNFCPSLMGELSVNGSELTDVKISKLIVESLKKVALTIF